MAGVTWHLYVVRTDKGTLYAGIATDVMRRYQEHVAGGPKAARFLRANTPRELVFSRRIGISDDGSIIPVDGGVRLSGKIGSSTNIGLLHMQTEAVDSIAPVSG